MNEPHLDLPAIYRLDWVARAKAIDQLKRILESLEERTLHQMPGHLRWQTPQHANLRKRCFERDGHQCTACGRQTRLRVHHLSYKRVGGRHEIHDVTTRCEQCHADVHRFTPRGYRNRTGQMRLGA